MFSIKYDKQGNVVVIILFRVNEIRLINKVCCNFRSYCNEDAYLMQVMVTGDGDREENNCYDITLTQT